MTATLTDTSIIVELGTGGGGALDAVKNTAILVAGAIDALAGVSSIHSGTGATALAAAEAEQDLTGGQYATKVAIYVAELGVSKTSTDGWKSATLS